MSTSYSAFPLTTKIGQMVKDVGHSISSFSHKMKSARPLGIIPRHSNIAAYRFCFPNAADAAFVAPNARVQGNVAFGHGTSIFYSTVVKNNSLQAGTSIGDHTVILDRCSIMGTTKIGDNCHIGIGCSLDSCIIKDGAYIGHGVTICYGSIIEEGAIVAAGSVVPMDTRVGPGELWAGNTAEKIEMVSAHQADEVQHIVHHAHDSAEAHQRSIDALYAKNETFDLTWLKRVQADVEAQQTSVAIKEAAEIPLEARRFIQPRVQARRREQTLRSSSNSSNVAPWNYKGPTSHIGNV